jgi:hypothetical protein
VSSFRDPLLVLHVGLGADDRRLDLLRVAPGPERERPERRHGHVDVGERIVAAEIVGRVVPDAVVALGLEQVVDGAGRLGQSPGKGARRRQGLLERLRRDRLVELEAADERPLPGEFRRGLPGPAAFLDLLPLLAPFAVAVHEVERDAVEPAGFVAVTSWKRRDRACRPSIAFRPSLRSTFRSSTSRPAFRSTPWRRWTNQSSWNVVTRSDAVEDLEVGAQEDESRLDEVADRETEFLVDAGCSGEPQGHELLRQELDDARHHERTGEPILLSTSFRSMGEFSMWGTHQAIGFPVALDCWWASLSERTQGISEPHFAAGP